MHVKGKYCKKGKRERARERKGTILCKWKRCTVDSESNLACGNPSKMSPESSVCKVHKWLFYSYDEMAYSPFLVFSDFKNGKSCKW